MRILFICKHNRFRSKVAETIFLALNKNKKIKAESAGLKLDELRPYIEENVLEIMKEKGYNIKGQPRKLTKDLIDNFDLIVLVADDIKKEYFSGFKGKMIIWKIKDTSANNVKEIREIIDEIERKVKELISNLK